MVWVCGKYMESTCSAHNQLISEDMGYDRRGSVGQVRVQGHFRSNVKLFIRNNTSDLLTVFE